MGTNPLFQIKNLRFTYGRGEKYAVDGIDLDIHEGCITSIIGANGCGKSTLFHLLSRMLKPSQGSITLRGTDISSISRKAYAREVSIVHQYNTATEDITVRKLVAMGRTPYHNALSGAYTKTDTEAIERALRITETEDFADTPVMKLSGGQRQRVWLAMALAQDTGILLLDEITTYLDIHYQIQLLRLTKELNEKYGITVLTVMHDINQALSYSHETVMMREGKILASGKTEEVIHPESLFDAFGVKGMMSEFGGQRYCIFEA